MRFCVILHNLDRIRTLQHEAVQAKGQGWRLQSKGGLGMLRDGAVGIARSISRLQRAFVGKKDEMG